MLFNTQNEDGAWLSDQLEKATRYYRAHKEELEKLYREVYQQTCNAPHGEVLFSQRRAHRLLREMSAVLHVEDEQIGRGRKPTMQQQSDASGDRKRCDARLACTPEEREVVADLFPSDPRSSEREYSRDAPAHGRGVQGRFKDERGGDDYQPTHRDVFSRNAEDGSAYRREQHQRPLALVNPFPTSSTPAQSSAYPRRSSYTNHAGPAEEAASRRCNNTEAMGSNPPQQRECERERYHGRPGGEEELSPVSPHHVDRTANEGLLGGNKSSPHEYPSRSAATLPSRRTAGEKPPLPPRDVERHVYATRNNDEINNGAKHHSTSSSSSYHSHHEEDGREDRKYITPRVYEQDTSERDQRDKYSDRRDEPRNDPSRDRYSDRRDEPRNDPSRDRYSDRRDEPRNDTSRDTYLNRREEHPPPRGVDRSVGTVEDGGVGSSRRRRRGIPLSPWPLKEEEEEEDPMELYYTEPPEQRHQEQRHDTRQDARPVLREERSDEPLRASSAHQDRYNSQDDQHHPHQEQRYVHHDGREAVWPSRASPEACGGAPRVSPLKQSRHDFQRQQDPPFLHSHAQQPYARSTSSTAGRHDEEEEDGRVARREEPRRAHSRSQPPSYSGHQPAGLVESARQSVQPGQDAADTPGKLRTATPRRCSAKVHDSRQIEEALYGTPRQPKQPLLHRDDSDVLRFMSATNQELREYRQREEDERRRQNQPRVTPAITSGPAIRREATDTEWQLQTELGVLRTQLERMELELMNRVQRQGESGSEVQYAQLHHRIRRVRTDMKRVEAELRVVKRISQRASSQSQPRPHDVPTSQSHMR